MKPRARLRRRAPSALLAVLVVPAVIATVPDASAQEPADHATTSTSAEPLLDTPQQGRTAIRQLGDQVAVAAARNDLRPTELRTLLRTDDTAWIDPRGRIYYVDPAPDPTHAAVDVPTAQVAPLSETFALHSNPGASLTILLDVDGAHVSGTAWNTYADVTPGGHPAWDPAGDGPAFSDGERLKVQQVWAMVAEDYAPFDVDVTTEDPGDAAMVRSSTSDTVHGTRVLITPSDDPFAKICRRTCGGVAYIDVFDRVGTTYQPAWVFPQALGHHPKDIAEAATHEAGHTLGLDHDGTAVRDYYTGHGVWAPLMGVGYGKPLTQWSQGSYPGADNQQDDLAVLAGHLGVRPDEAGGSHATPSRLPRGEAFIATPDDVDAYLLGTCAAGTVVEVLPAAVAPNLDVRAVLVDAEGAHRALAQPRSGLGDWTTASGLGGSLTVPATGDGWVLTVEGAGEGAWLSGGYDDYGSLGAYTVSAPGCAGEVPSVPSAPAGVSADRGDSSATITWTTPDDNGSPITGYTVLTRTAGQADRTATVGGDITTTTITGLTNGTPYTFTVRATNAVGDGPESAASATVVPERLAPPEPEATAPGTMASPKVVVRGSRAVVRWQAATSNGSTITRYLIDVDPGRDTSATGTARRAVLKQLEPGRYRIRVAARNAVGTSPWSRWASFRIR